MVARLVRNWDRNADIFVPARLNPTGQCVDWAVQQHAAEGRLRHNHHRRDDAEPVVRSCSLPHTHSPLSQPCRLVGSLTTVQRRTGQPTSMRTCM